MRYVIWAVLASVLVLPMTFVNAAPNRPVVTTVVSAATTLPLTSLTANVVEPIQPSVSIEVAKSSPYLREQAVKRAAVAAGQAKVVTAKIADPIGQNILNTIRYCESRDNYQAQNRRSTASGAYQFLDSTWAHYGGYARAKDAPQQVQDEKAKLTVQLRGTAPWNASRSCWSR